MLNRLICVFILFTFITLDGKEKSYIALIESHLKSLTSNGTDSFGPVKNSMWMSIINVETGKPPVKPHTPSRTYREIGAPRGTSFYWDQSLAVAALNISRITNNRKYSDSVYAYRDSFMERCIDSNGIFMWGNHIYYDAYKDEVRKFNRGYHELRTITPAWEIFWKKSPEVTEKYIRVMTERHITNKKTGEFNRHDDGKRGIPFLESGGVLVESLCWLWTKNKDSELLKTALLIASYSFKHRGKETGLIRNQPIRNRWDKKVSTTEVGRWAGSILAAYRYTQKKEFLEMAEKGVLAYLKFGFDKEEGKYFGQLNIENGKAVSPEKVGYWPRKYSDLWTQDQWPTHDYPMSMAITCLDLYKLTGKKDYLTAIKRWKVIIEKTVASKNQAYAYQYGRCISFLVLSGQFLKDQSYLYLAKELAAEAVSKLFKNGMFKSHTDNKHYESVGGVGELAMVLFF